MTLRLNLTRDQLASFLKSPEQIKQFENMFMSVDGLIPIVPVEKGGTGLASLPAIGEVLIGDGTKYSLNTLTAGAGIGIANAPGDITLSNTGVLSFSGGVTGLTPAALSTGDITLDGTLNVGNGGTGQTSYNDGEILIGDSTGNTLSKATLTAGANITITNGAGSIVIDVSGLGTMAYENIGASGSFTAASGEVVTVVNGIITSIV